MKIKVKSRRLMEWLRYLPCVSETEVERNSNPGFGIDVLKRPDI